MPTKGAVGGSIGSINNSGDVSGSYFTQGKESDHSYGFIRLANGTITQIDIPNSHHNTYAGPIDDNDNVTGSYETSDNGFMYHAFLRTPDGTITSFDAPGAFDTEPEDINSGVIVGMYDAPDTWHGFMRTADGTITTIDYPGSTHTYAWSINSSGQIAGTYNDESGTLHGFVRQTDGSIDSIDPPDSVYTDNLAINDAREISGIYQDGSSGKYYGFLLKGGKFYASERYFSRMNSHDEGVGQNFHSYLLTFKDKQFFPTRIAPPRGCSNYFFLSGINNNSLVVGEMQCTLGKAGWYGYLLQE